MSDLPRLLTLQKASALCRHDHKRRSHLSSDRTIGWQFRATQQKYRRLSLQGGIATNTAQSSPQTMPPLALRCEHDPQAICTACSAGSS